MSRTIGQLIRFGVVGLISNAVGYGLYLLLTYIGVGPRLAMSLLYCVGVLQTFILNRRWTFNHKGLASEALGRYIALYGTGYVFNILAMSFGIEIMDWSHQWIMLALMLLMPILFFVGQKFLVFRSAIRS